MLKGLGKAWSSTVLTLQTIWSSTASSLHIIWTAYVTEIQASVEQFLIILYWTIGQCLRHIQKDASKPLPSAESQQLIELRGEHYTLVQQHLTLTQAYDLESRLNTADRQTLLRHIDSTTMRLETENRRLRSQCTDLQRQHQAVVAWNEFSDDYNGQLTRLHDENRRLERDYTARAQAYRTLVQELTRQRDAAVAEAEERRREQRPVLTTRRAAEVEWLRSRIDFLEGHLGRVLHEWGRSIADNSAMREVVEALEREDEGQDGDVDGDGQYYDGEEGEDGSEGQGEDNGENEEEEEEEWHGFDGEADDNNDSNRGNAEGDGSNQVDDGASSASSEL